MMCQPLLILLVLASAVLAAPTARHTTPGRTCGGGGGRKDSNSTTTTTTTTTSSSSDGGGVTITAATIEAIMPLSASCDGRGTECATASLAAPYLAASLDDYGVQSAYERAGVLALIAYESVQLQYRMNQNAEQLKLGRGTANQQGGEFNVEYANSFPELASLSLTTSTVLEQVTQDKYNFATGAWYYSQQATDACVGARSAAQQSDTTAWEWFSTVYLADCVGVNITAQVERTEYWNNALQAFGLTNGSTNAGASTAA